MFVVVPVSKLHTENEISIKDVTISSSIALDYDPYITINGTRYCYNVAIDHIFNKINCNFGIYEISVLDKSNHIEALIEALIHPVDFALDCLRLDLNSFTFYEQAIGTPGLYGENKTVFLLNEHFELVDTLVSSATFYDLSVGIGCNATDYYFDDDHLLTLNRSDEVYIKYRGILHRLLKSITIYDVDTAFTVLFSMIEGMDCAQSNDFKTKKIRILSFISNTQETFDILSNQFYFYSKEVRTAVIHSDISIHDLLPWKEIYSLLDDLYLLVVRFCKSVINCGSTTFVELEKKITDQCEKFEYTPPVNSITINEMPRTHSGTCSYFAEINNLNLTKFLKIGDALIVPKKGADMVFSLGELYDYGLRLSNAKQLPEEDILIDSTFPNFDLLSEFNIREKSFNLWDIDVILTYLLKGIDMQSPFVILQNQPYWESQENGFDVIFHNEFTDIICNKIQEYINYFLIFESYKNDISLPSKAGINSSGIRIAYFNPNDSLEIHAALGRVYAEYIEPPLQCTPKLSKQSNSLYYYFASSRKDEVFLANRKALMRIAESIYFNNINEKFLAMFDALEMLYPTTYDGNKLMRRVAVFSSKSFVQEQDVFKNLKHWRKTIRNPLLHGGKSITNLQLTYEEALSILDSMKNIITTYCENVYNLSIHTFKEMDAAQTDRNIIK